MTGLEKILKEIQDEAASEAEAVLAKANASAGEILTKAKAEAEAKSQATAENAQKNVADIVSSRDSALGLQKRQRTLETKQALLSETLEKALQELYALHDGAYFDLLLRLASSSAEAGEGQMLLNEKDKQRLPADFQQKLAGALPTGCSIQVSGEVRPIDGGFVLKYGDVEENCSFAAIFNARREEFADLISPILFAAE